MTSDFFYRAEFELSYGYYRPVTTLSYVFDHWLWGLKPFGYHLTNLLLHAICSVSVGLILIRLDFDPEPALLTALLFAVHPIHSENVAWISGRTDLLAFFFCSLSALAHLAATKASRPGEVGATLSSRRRVSRSRPADARRSRLLLGASMLAFAGAFLLLKPVSFLAVPFQGGPSESDGASSPEPIPQKIKSLFRACDEGLVGMFFKPQLGEALVQDSNRTSQLPARGREHQYIVHVTDEEQPGLFETPVQLCEKERSEQWRQRTTERDATSELEEEPTALGHAATHLANEVQHVAIRNHGGKPVE